MFQDQELLDHIQSSSTIKINSAILAEWNMNISNNISVLGNYRYRPSEGISTVYGTLVNNFDINDEGYFYTDATDASIVVDGGYEYSEDAQDNKTPVIFQSKKENEKLLFSLEDCLNRFRPRSGINKLRFFDNKFLHYVNADMANRPRYYMANKHDRFKYWTSYRTEPMYRYSNINLYTPRPYIDDLDTNTRIYGIADPAIERGIANKIIDGTYVIDDAAPFVVYKDSIPTNRIVVKMQTNVGSVNNGPFFDGVNTFEDPFYGLSNQTTPVKWRIQYLEDGIWNDAVIFDQNSTRLDGSPIIGDDGYVEISYGLKVPYQYSNIFSYVGIKKTRSELPESAFLGAAYWVKANEADHGEYYIWTGESYESFIPDFGWHLTDEGLSHISNYMTDVTSPIGYARSSDSKITYAEFQFIQGIRIVVETMNKFDSSFDLIELSPRLIVDISDKTQQFSINKIASDLGVSGLPVGQLLASTGSIDLFDYDQAFNQNNSNSIISKYLNQNLQIKFYEIVEGPNLHSYHIPIKVLYAEGFPDINSQERSVSITLRDLFFYFESMTAPQIFIQDVSLSYAISLLLDNIGFSNYVFKRLDNEPDPIIDSFFIAPDKTVAEVLQDLAISTQSLMFFDEYNNFVVMSKEYVLPDSAARDTDITLYGSSDSVKSGALINKSIGKPLADIIEIASQESRVYNDGTINYTSRSIQRTERSIKQANLLDSSKTIIYKPSIVWEVSPTEKIRTVNSESSNASSYSLSAIPLNSDLSDAIPYVINNQIQNNTIDFGEGIYYLSRFSGYFYANGEIIRYDAAEFSVTSTDGSASNVWISNNQEYQYYVSKLPFNGKIYPTGLVRIYTEPNYEVVNGETRLQVGQVAKHGRGQFGTKVVSHSAGLGSHWLNNSNARTCEMDSQYLFKYILNSDGDLLVPSVTTGPAGPRPDMAQRLIHTGKIKNFLANYFSSDSNELRTYVNTGASQASALVMTGPTTAITESPINFISYMYKPLNDKFRHFGTRMRVAGKIVNNENRTQIPDGIMPYVTVSNESPQKSVNIGGGSGGIGIMVNPATNNGYYLEVIALSESGLEGADNLNNIIFYKIQKDSASSLGVPIKLWGANATIFVDTGLFEGQQRLTGSGSPSVHDIAIEYEDIGKTRRFYLYLNDRVIGVVDDESPLDIYNNVALFVRGTSTVFFENIYALTNNYSQNTAIPTNAPIASVFEDNEVNANEAFRKYAMSGVVQSTYLSNISTSKPPEYNLYYEEFGTLMREMAYIKARYDKAYPAMNTRLLPTLDRVKGYVASGFSSGAYTAEFLVFNATDSVLNLDSGSSNYLRIQGIVFTQGSTEEYSVDDYFAKNSDLSEISYSSGATIESTVVLKQKFNDIKYSRMTYGKNGFSLDAPYVQNIDEANNLMGWIISKIMKPRKSVGVRIFANPMIQLGDIVEIDYISKDGIDQVLPSGTRYIVYNIEYVRDGAGPSMTIYLSEV